MANDDGKLAGEARKTHVEAVRAERESIAARPEDHPTRDRRLADIDTELGKYGEKPNDGARRGRAETAVKGPDA